jgi:hypothetical protein
LSPARWPASGLSAVGDKPVVGEDQGAWYAATGVQALGPLLLTGAPSTNSAITFPSGSSTLRLANSSAQACGFGVPCSSDGRVPAPNLSMRCDDWEPLTLRSLLGFGAAFSAFLLLVFLSEPGFVLILDHANLLFHEAGHPLVGLLSSRLVPYGGTLGQLAFPAILCALSWRRGQPLGVAASAIWFFENLLNIARYLADARMMELPLVGGGDHDWNTILSRWTLLQHDGQIAAGLRVVAWLGIAAACAWVTWRAWHDRRQPAGPPLAVEIGSL